MNERNQRLKILRGIIRDHRIESQERLLDHLKEEGYHITQATLSRDLKMLKVGKQAIGEEGYYYALPSEEVLRDREKHYLQDFLRGYVSLDVGGNVVVIRTITGHANSVAIALDALRISSVLGTIAGDDTVFAALRSDVSEAAFLAELRERVPDFED